MSIYGGFTSSMLAMMSQSQAMNTIAMNIANSTTNGYKGSETRFSTVLSEQVSAVSDLGGVRPTDYQLVDKQGALTSSARSLDIGINGNGFFLLNSNLDGSGETFLTRNGSFSMVNGGDIQATDENGDPITAKSAYLVDKNGYFVQGWDTDYLGAFTPEAATTSLRDDPYAFVNEGQATTDAKLGLNIPAQENVGDTHVYDIELFDNQGNSETAILNFTKTATNTWDLSATYNAGATTSPTQSLTFNSDGTIASPTSASIAFSFTGGSATTVAFDISGITQYSGDFVPDRFSQNGFTASSMSKFTFDEDGSVLGHFGDSTQRPLYRLALGVVSNPNALVMKNGNLFQESSESGLVDVTYAKGGSGTRFSPFSNELSNVDIADEFAKMIMTQNAYNSAATVFRTVDEMTVSARDLKR